MPLNTMCCVEDILLCTYITKNRPLNNQDKTESKRKKRKIKKYTTRTTCAARARRRIVAFEKFKKLVEVKTKIICF